MSKNNFNMNSINHLIPCKIILLTYFMMIMGCIPVQRLTYGYYTINKNLNYRIHIISLEDIHLIMSHFDSIYEINFYNQLPMDVKREILNDIHIATKDNYCDNITIKKKPLKQEIFLGPSPLFYNNRFDIMYSSLTVHTFKKDKDGLKSVFAWYDIYDKFIVFRTREDMLEKRFINLAGIIDDDGNIIDENAWRIIYKEEV